VDAKRTPYNKTPAEIDQVLSCKKTVEPHLRHGATGEIDTAIPLQDVASRILSITLGGDA
jgi:hypothetical protein